MKYLFVSCFVFISILGSAQNLPVSVKNNFCRNAVINYKYGSNAFKAWMIQAARSAGFNTMLDIEVAVENIANESRLREKFFENIVRTSGSNRDLVFIQFSSIGMTAANAKALTDYAIKKHGYISSSIQQNNVKVEPAENDNSDDKVERQPFMTTKCRTFNPAFLYEKADIKSKKVYQLKAKAIVYVYTNSYKEMPGKFVRCICYNAQGKSHEGYILSSQLEWLQAG